MAEKITAQTIVNEPVEKVWDAYNNPKHIVKWAFASEDWKAPKAENDLRVGGKFVTRMEAKDGSAGFDFGGTYSEVVPPNPSNPSGQARIAYTMDDGRNAEIDFEEIGNSTAISIAFDPENENPIEMQKNGWQAILENFKKYTENLK